jgi:hypothetical protein
LQKTISSYYVLIETLKQIIMMRIINDIRMLSKALYGQTLTVNHVADLLDSGKDNCIKLRDELKQALVEESEMALVK